jgi:hypothetical protein
MKYVLFLLATFFSGMVLAQNVDYKKGKILVDGQEYLTLEVIKMNFGLTKNFEVFTPAGVKVASAEVNATKYESDKNDNSFLYYDVVFYPSGQKAVFKVASMGQEKSFAQLIGGSDILVNSKPDDTKIQAFISRRSVTPKIFVDYTPVSRNRSWPIEIKSDRQITQESKLIGYFVASYSDGNGSDTYQFYLPSGTRLADISFVGGNNAQQFELFTHKEKNRRLVAIPQKDKILAADQSIDKNYFTLKRVVKWLVDNQIL